MTARILCLVLLTTACAREAHPPPLAAVKRWQVADAFAAIDLAPDGQSALLGNATGEPSLWSAPWSLSVYFETADARLRAAGFGSEGQVLIVRALGMQAAIEHRASSGALIDVQVPRLARDVSRALLSPSGRYVAFDRRVYDVQGQRIVAQDDTEGEVAALAFAEDRAALIATERSVAVFAFDGSEPRRWNTGAQVTAAALTTDARSVAAATLDAIEIWHRGAPEPACVMPLSLTVGALQFSRSGGWLAAIGGSELRLIDVPSCRTRTVVPLGAEASALDVDDDLIAFGDARGRVWVWDAYNGKLLARSQELAGPVSLLRVHAGSRTILAAGGGEAKLLRVN
jgi:WD40 repeat protein